MRYLFALMLLLGYVTSVFSAQITGRVVLGDKPLQGMQVRAYADLNPAARPIAESVATLADGLFQLDVPEGFVALYANSADGRYFAFCGRNPLMVTGQSLWAGLQAVEVSPAATSAYDDEYSAALQGVVTYRGKPLSNAYVSLYLDVVADLKGQGYRLSAPTDKDGIFVFDGLPETGYFLVARKRENDARVGPLAAGDMLGVYAGNPISLKSGIVTEVELPMVVRQPNENSPGLPDRPGSSTLAGRILDSSGQPRAGLHVFAYTDSVIGHQRPAALSSETTADGRFAISFREPGIYYVGARQAYGDSPAPGELFGLYQGQADHGLKIEPGVNEPIEIQVVPISLD
jgi:hypothetical protein